jgi:dnd system-associated protein 4
VRDRIRPPKDLEIVLDELKELRLFQTKQKGMMFAAAMGYTINSKKDQHERPERYGEGIRLEYFQSPEDDGYINALAVAAHGTLEILADDRTDDRFDLFERYANTGLIELKRRLDSSRHVDRLEVILDILDDLGGDSQGDDSNDARVRRLAGLV